MRLDPALGLKREVCDANRSQARLDDFGHTVGAVLILAIWYSIGSSREKAGYWPLLILALCPLMHQIESRRVLPRR